MSLELLVEGIVFGAVFTQTEVFFNAALLADYRKTPQPITPPHPDNGEPITGHSYPLMFFLGALAAPALHYLVPLLQNIAGTTGVAAGFAAGIPTIEIICGTAGYAPWNNVYHYLEKRTKYLLPFLKNIPLTLKNNSVFLPLIPAWAGLGIAITALHDKLHHLSPYSISH